MKKIGILIIILVLLTITYAAEVKWTAVSELTAINDADILLVVDDVAGSPTSKKITVLNFFDTINTFAKLDTIVTDKTLINEEDAITLDSLLTTSAGINLGTSQSIIGTTAVTLGNNAQTWAINSSDWDIGATGIMTGIGNITSDGTIQGNSLTDGTATLTGGALTGLTTPLTVAQGGSGAATFTDGGILLGSGAGTFTVLGVATNGQIPIGDGATDPVLATISGGTSVTVTNGAGTISVAVDDDFLANDGDIGTGVYDFGGADSIELVNNATPTTNATGEIALDITIVDHQPLWQYFDGGENMTIIAIDTAQLPAQDNEIVKYDAATDKFVLEADAGAGGGDAWSDAVDSDILPTGNDNTFDLGSVAASFKDIFWDGTATGNVTGALTGNADTVTTNANLTGEVTSAGNAATIADSVTVTGWVLGASSATTLTVTNNIKTEPKHFRFNIINPLATQTEDNEICLIPAIDADITITKIEVTLNASGNEVAGDLKYADTFIGLASATVINVFDTTSGVLSDDTITSGAVASGKAIYIAFDSAPNTAITQMCVDITYDYD